MLTESNFCFLSLTCRYYLVDKGYPNKEGYLVPYPKVRYRQSQFENELPTNA